MPLHAGGKVLGLDAAALNAGQTRVELQDDVASGDGYDRQLFKFVAEDKESFSIRPKLQESRGLTVQDGSYYNRANIVSQNYTGEIYQKWYLREISQPMTSSATYTSDGNYLASVTDTFGNTVSYG